MQKGENLNISKTNPSLSKIMIGLGWDVNSKKTTNSYNFDLDASVFMMSKDSKLQWSDVVYFNNLKSPCKSVIHQGDNLTGEGDGDDEQILVDLKKIPTKFEKLLLIVNIYQANQRSQRFGMVDNSYIRLVDNETGTEVARYDLREDASSATGIIFGELYLHNGDWKFRALGDTVNGSLDEIAGKFVV